MLKIQWILGPALLLGSTAMTASAQSRAYSGGGTADNTSPYRQNVRKAGALTQAPGLITKQANKHALSTYETSRYAGIVTVPEQARSILPRNRLPSRFDMQPLPTTPVQSWLNRQNLLALRSPLARKMTSTIGRNDFVTDPETGQMFGDYSRIQKRVDAAKPGFDTDKSDDGSYQDAIVKRLQAKADEYYDLGTAAFRQSKLTNAANYFDLVKDIEYDKTRAYLAKAIVAVQRADYLTAHGNLLRAMDLAQDLDSLKIDVSKFYKSPEDFRRRTELLNLQTQKYTESPIATLTLSYYLWINGDMETAITTATAAEKHSPGLSNVPVKKFRDFLILKRTGPKPGPTGASTSSITAPSPLPSTSQKSP